MLRTSSSHIPPQDRACNTIRRCLPISRAFEPRSNNMRLPADWIAPDWPAPRRVHAFVTTRNGGVSTGAYASLNLGTRVGDDAAAVCENRSRVRALLPNDPKWLRQVHGTHVAQADAMEADLEADAAITRTPDNVCVVQVADCLPVLFCDRAGSCVGAAHAGWRGLSAGVLESAIAAMSVPADELIAWLGPAIGPNAFEVGADVRDAFAQTDPNGSAFVALRPGKWLADLFVLARLRLAARGVTAVFGGNLCTASDAKRFFSHRRDGVSGRQAAFIWLD
jgi:YfiH family protein